MECAVNDLDALQKTCEKRGWILVRGQKTYAWVGKWFDDSPTPRSLFVDEDEYRRVLAMTKPQRTYYMQRILGHCEHAIKIPGHHCEVGVVRVGEHLRLVWDWASTLREVMGTTDSWGRDNLTNLTPFLHDYAEAYFANQMIDLHGNLVEKTLLPDGSLYLEYEHE